jgi:hypothetical protein
MGAGACDDGGGGGRPLRGFATGLFATSIRFVQLVLFRGGEVARTLFGPGREIWGRYFPGAAGGGALALWSSPRWPR